MRKLEERAIWDDNKEWREREMFPVRGRMRRSWVNTIVRIYGAVAVCKCASTEVGSPS